MKGMLPVAMILKFLCFAVDKMVAFPINWWFVISE
jgi:hypothetical protein